MLQVIRRTSLLRMLPAIFLLTLLLAVFEARSQEDEGGEASGEAQPAPEGGGAPVVIEEEPYEYYYWPDEDLNNFGLSSMGKGTTMGQTPQRKSNLEVNPPKPKPSPEPDDEDDEETPPEGSLDAGSGAAPEVGAGRQTGGSGTAFYRWVDDKGNVHYTNNLGEVPLEYQQQMYRQENP